MLLPPWFVPPMSPTLSSATMMVTAVVSLRILNLEVAKMLFLMIESMSMNKKGKRVDETLEE